MTWHESHLNYHHPTHTNGLACSTTLLSVTSSFGSTLTLSFISQSHTSTLIHLYNFLSCHHPTPPLWSIFTPFLSCHHPTPYLNMLPAVFFSYSADEGLRGRSNPAVAMLSRSKAGKYAQFKWSPIIQESQGVPKKVETCCIPMLAIPCSKNICKRKFC